MQRKFLILILSSFFLLSCNSDDGTNSNAVLVKKAEANGITFQYKYNGNKLSKIIVDDVEEVFTYSGDLIVNIKKYYTGTNLVISESQYTYDSNHKMIQEVLLYYQDNLGSKMVYTHNVNGSVSFQTYDGSLTSQINLTQSGFTYLNNEGNVSKVEIYNGANLYSTTEYVYDDKNSTHKNITGYDKLLSNFHGNKNNVISRRVYDGNNTLVNGFDSVFTYNSNDFPSSVITTTTGSTSPTTVNYFY